MGGAIQAKGLSDFRSDFELGKIMPSADRLGPVEGTPPSTIAYRGAKELGYVFLNSTAASSIGYSGKPIHIVIGVNKSGVITGARMVKHSEPIVLVGIPVKKIRNFIAGYVGLNVIDFIETKRRRHDVDIVSGATVTVMVIEDSIIRSAIKVLRQRKVAASVAATGAREDAVLRSLPAQERDWKTLLGDGSVRRLTLNLSDVNQAFEKINAAAAARPERGKTQDVFIDLYAAVASIPTIGKSLLGAREYRNLKSTIKPGQTAILIAGRGRYSFKGSGYVRGGIFDRIQLIQGDVSVRFRDKFHKRIGEFLAVGAPHLPEIGLFYVPPNSGFDPARPWRLQLLVARAIGPIQKAFTTFELAYRPPNEFIKVRRITAEKSAAAGLPTIAAPTLSEEQPLWQRIWEEKILDIAILLLALAALTVVFFFQDWFARRPRLVLWGRRAFLAFTVIWIGFYANAQLSIVNVLAFVGALLTGFRWDFFLMEPLIFILWGSVAASLLFWGRGVYCGWLCPFGALQELLNTAAKSLKIPQVAVPWALHERLWPIKYIVFLGILGLSLYSFELAEMAAEIEPFKTAIILKFVRTWPFVLFAVGMLGVGLFIERFYCRYLCPMGGALGIPGRMRMNEWLRRYRECGAPCQRCAHECMVQAIHPDGHINPNECLQCLHCQVVYYDDQNCPVMIQRRLKRERRVALRSTSLKSKSPPVGGNE
ncbi:MAG: regulatory protein NosR [Rhodospirillaceae bacterium]|jgi:NosR/NirI family nitrous oxide reductase transcriptional regulator|nr:regulatory protein NosR [Rhodospirillaceae bacterium]MBT5667770.1 regulatory protein NosR [Rhodospirillaceae bacterium]MBT5810025.1 regulatory protein NosR [Rhodospirillaceae bacterium]